MDLPDEYDIASHGRMLRDRIRVSAYVEALRSAVTSDSVVLDIGTGVGFFAVVAAKLGARRVIGVEQDATVYVARGVVEDNDVTDIVTLIKGSSLGLELTELADIVVSDLRGVLPLYGRHLSAIIDARERLARPGAVLIPRKDDLFVAVASCDQIYRTFEQPWSGFSDGITLEFARQFAVNSSAGVQGEPGMLLGRPQMWTTLDYTALTEINAQGAVVSRVDRPGSAHGLLVWFDASLTPEVGYSNAPGASRCVYGQMFFPFERAVAVEEGDQVSIEIAARAHEGGYLWSWNTRIIRCGHSIEVFRQSTVRGWVIPP